MSQKLSLKKVTKLFNETWNSQILYSIEIKIYSQILDQSLNVVFLISGILQFMLNTYFIKFWNLNVKKKKIAAYFLHIFFIFDVFIVLINDTAFIFLSVNQYFFTFSKKICLIINYSISFHACCITILRGLIWWERKIIKSHAILWEKYFILLLIQINHNMDNWIFCLFK